MLAFMHAHVRAHTHTHTHERESVARTWTCTRVHMHACTHTHTCTRESESAWHAHIHVHTHTHASITNCLVFAVALGRSSAGHSHSPKRTTPCMGDHPGLGHSGHLPRLCGLLLHLQRCLRWLPRDGLQRVVVERIALCCLVTAVQDGCTEWVWSRLKQNSLVFYVMVAPRQDWKG